MTRQERLLRLARLRGDRAAELIMEGTRDPLLRRLRTDSRKLADLHKWTETELRAAWGDR